MTTACAYSRCSGVSQIDGDTWDRQIEAINSCCASQGLTLIHEYRDEAVPGKTGEESRPGFSGWCQTSLAMAAGLSSSRALIG